jgi:hypothetical protein
MQIINLVLKEARIDKRALLQERLTNMVNQILSKKINISSGDDSATPEFLSKPVAQGNGFKIYKVTDVDQCIKISKGTSFRQVKQQI